METIGETRLPSSLPRTSAGPTTAWADYDAPEYNGDSLSRANSSLG